MLKGIQVIEFEGLAPSLFCGMFFADQGAEVTIIARSTPAPFSMPLHLNIMNRGKKSVCLDPKNSKDKQIIQNLILHADVIIDPYRPGVLEKLKLGPEQIKKINKKAVLLRVSGYGQEGSMSKRPGHDLNYLSYSGIIPLINKDQQKLQFPTNYLADFVSSSLGVYATMAAMLISKKSGVGGVIDCSLSEGCRYLTHLTVNSPNDNKNVPVFFRRVQNKIYCITSSLNQMKENKVEGLIAQMQQKGMQYLQKSNIQISRVQGIGKFEEQLNGGLKNPFEPKLKASCLLPRRQNVGKLNVGMSKL